MFNYCKRNENKSNEEACINLLNIKKIYYIHCWFGFGQGATLICYMRMYFKTFVGHLDGSVG